MATELQGTTVDDSQVKTLTSRTFHVRDVRAALISCRSVMSLLWVSQTRPFCVYRRVPGLRDYYKVWGQWHLRSELWYVFFSLRVQVDCEKASISYSESDSSSGDDSTVSSSSSSSSDAHREPDTAPREWDRTVPPQQLESTGHVQPSKFHSNTVAAKQGK